MSHTPGGRRNEFRRSLFNFLPTVKPLMHAVLVAPINLSRYLLLVFYAPQSIYHSVARMCPVMALLVKYNGFARYAVYLISTSNRLNDTSVGLKLTPQHRHADLITFGE